MIHMTGCLLHHWLRLQNIENINALKCVESFHIYPAMESIQLFKWEEHIWSHTLVYIGGCKNMAGEKKTRRKEAKSEKKKKWLHM